MASGREYSWKHAPDIRDKHDFTIEPRGFVIRFFGRLSSREIREIAQSRQAEPDFDRVSYVLYDFEECSEVTLDSDEMDYLAANDWAASLSHPGPLVILLWPIRPDTCALAASYRAARISPWNVHVVASEKVARCWLVDATDLGST